MQNSPPNENLVSFENELDLQHIVRSLWSGKWLIGGVGGLVAIVAVVVSIMLPNIYRAEALLSPNDSQGASELSALASQYGSLASLAGINLAGGTDKTALGLEILQSRRFISEFVARHDILVPLIAVDKWDPASGELVIDPGVYDVEVQEWVRTAKPPKKAIPSSQEAYDQFREILSVHVDKQSGLVTVAVEHHSPLVARQWVDWLVADLNEFTMRQDVNEAEQAIEYLKEQINSTSVANLQSVFFNLIEEQSKTVMLAKVTDEYLLKTIDPAVVPERKARPARSIIVLVSTVMGLLLGLAIVLLRSSSRGHKTA